MKLATARPAAKSPHNHGHVEQACASKADSTKFFCCLYSGEPLLFVYVCGTSFREAKEACGNKAKPFKACKRIKNREPLKKLTFALSRRFVQSSTLSRGLRQLFPSHFGLFGNKTKSVKFEKLCKEVCNNEFKQRIGKRACDRACQKEKCFCSILFLQFVPQTSLSLIVLTQSHFLSASLSSIALIVSHT